jgi:hypothetical protein
MDKMKVRRISAGRIVLAGLLFFSGSGLWRCSADEENYFQEETLTETISLGQLEAYDALEVDYLVEVEFVLAGFSGSTTVLTDAAICATFTNDPINKVLTLDFGDTCSRVSFFNRIRSGKIIVNYPTHVGDTVANRILTFENYYVDQKKLDGRIELDSISGDTIQLHGHCTFTNFKVTFPDGSGAIYNGTQNRLWSSGENDFDPNNNSYIITNVSESLSGTTLDGRSFSSRLLTVDGKGNPAPAVVLNYYCAISGDYAGISGIVTVPQLSGFEARTREVNLGSVCDDQVTIITWRRSFPLIVN